MQPIVPRDMQTTVDLHQLMGTADLNPKRKWILKIRVIGEIVSEITVEIPEIVMDRKDQDQGHKRKVKIENIPT